MTKTPDALAIYGAGGHAKVVLAALEAAGKTTSHIFDDAAADLPFTILGHSVAKPPEPSWWKLDEAPASAHIAIGSNAVRKTLSETTPAPNWATIIHPSAIVHPTAQIGPGCFIGARTVIQPDTKIGPHTIINTGAIIEHDCTIGAYAHIAPSVTLCGNTSVGEGTLVGVGSSTIPGMTIGSWAAIGASSTIVRPIGDNEVAFGSPARSHRRNEP